MKSEMNAVRDDPKAAVQRTGIGFVPVPGAGELYGAFKGIKNNDATGIRAAAAEELVEDMIGSRRSSRQSLFGPRMDYSCFSRIRHRQERQHCFIKRYHARFGRQKRCCPV
jgi:hypothetical protein